MLLDYHQWQLKARYHPVYDQENTENPERKTPEIFRDLFEIMGAYRRGDQSQASYVVALERIVWVWESLVRAYVDGRVSSHRLTKLYIHVISFAMLMKRPDDGVWSYEWCDSNTRPSSSGDHLMTLLTTALPMAMYLNYPCMNSWIIARSIACARAQA
jgi:hypothetical protein